MGFQNYDDGVEGSGNTLHVCLFVLVCCCDGLGWVGGDNMLVSLDLYSITSWLRLFSC